MLKEAAKFSGETVSQLRSAVAKLAHQISQSGQAKTQSEAWRMAWSHAKAFFGNRVLAKKLSRIMSRSDAKSWAFSFAADISEKMKYAHKGQMITLSQKQHNKINELYAQI